MSRGLPTAGAPVAALQQPDWPEPTELGEAVRTLAGLPALVNAAECDLLTTRLAEASRGEAFVLTGGDCAETFAANTADSVRSRLKTILQMAVVLTYGATLPVVKIGRMAGQYAKPRSRPTERIGERELPAYRGDAINDLSFTPEARRADPFRMVRAYHAATATLNLIRSFTQGGSADLRMVHAWNRDFAAATPQGERYERMAADITRALAFMHACGADPEEFRRVEFFTSHEALLLDYERALTRVDPRTGWHYALSAHLLWIGERTREPAGAHVDFVSRVRNPIGIKVGPDATPTDLVEVVERVDPDGVPGRLMLIARMGADRVTERLPALVKAVGATGRPVLWICDPMHGNTRVAASGHKTRVLGDIMAEVQGYFEVHRSLGSHPGGIHIELTGDDVTECVGGIAGISEVDLPTRYETACDPRLNRVQSLELAFRVAEMLAGGAR